MDQGPLVSEQITAGEELIRKFNDYAPIQTAFWLKEGDGGNWYLYLTSAEINDSNFTNAYGEVVRLTLHPPHPWLDPFQVKVAGMNNKLAAAVNEIQRQHPSPFPTRLHNRMLGGLYVDEAFIYPPLATASAVVP